MCLETNCGTIVRDDIATYSTSMYTPSPRTFSVVRVFDKLLWWDGQWRESYANLFPRKRTRPSYLSKYVLWPCMRPIQPCVQTRSTFLRCVWAAKAFSWLSGGLSLLLIKLESVCVAVRLRWGVRSSISDRCDDAIENSHVSTVRVRLDSGWIFPRGCTSRYQGVNEFNLAERATPLWAIL